MASGASLAVVQIGITLVGATAAATGGAGAEESIEPMLLDWGVSRTTSQFLAIAIVVVPLVVVTILLGELVPKVFALRNKEWVCLTLSPVMQWFSYCVWPAVWFLETCVTGIMKWGEKGRESRDEAEDEVVIQDLHGAATLARVSRLIGHREESIILGASRLATTPIRRVMLPAEHIGMLSADQSLAEALIVAHQEMHTRFPLTEVAGDPQRIIGYVNFKDIVAALRLSPQDPSLRNLLRPLPNFAANTSVADCLEQLMHQRIHIALVLGADGKTIGMVTLEDIIEELVGEIHDEFDRIPAHLVRSGQGWIAGGFVPLRQLRDESGIQLTSLSDKPLYTLNDWIVERLGRPPQGGDEIREDGCRVVVRKTRQTLVQEAYLCKLQSDEVGNQQYPAGVSGNFQNR
ncbi:MAG: hemolysin family protein [bacterium]|nr:hemolysin family protein [bacterium]